MHQRRRAPLGQMPELGHCASQSYAVWRSRVSTSAIGIKAQHTQRSLQIRVLAVSHPCPDSSPHRSWRDWSRPLQHGLVHVYRD